MRIELDGRCMTDRTVAHAYLKEKLSFPEHYGNNLDALYDLLTEDCSPKNIVLLYTDALEKNLAGYALAMIETFHQAAEVTPALLIEIE